MFKSLQFQDKNSKKFNFQIKKKEQNEKKPSLISINGQKYVIQRTNLDYQKRFSQKVQQVKTPANNNKAINNQKMKVEVIDQNQNTTKIKRNNYLEDNNKTVKKKTISRMRNEKSGFEKDQLMNREDRQIDLKETSLKLEKYDQQRQNFINYLAYLIQYVNSEQENDKKIRIATFFRAIQIFDLFLSKQNDKLDQQQVFTTTQACILIASKVEDIYYIELDQIEYDQSLQNKLLIQEQKILETIDYDIQRITELSLMNQYLGLFKPNDQQVFRKTSLKNLMVLMKDHRIRQFKSSEIVQSILVYSFIQEFIDDFGRLESLILEQKWDQDLMHQIITILEKKMQHKQLKYLENIKTIIK